jgi:hypothetical protein
MPTGCEAKMCVGHKQCALQKVFIPLVKLYSVGTVKKMVLVKNIAFYHDEKIVRP